MGDKSLACDPQSDVPGRLSKGCVTRSLTASLSGSTTQPGSGPWPYLPQPCESAATPRASAAVRCAASARPCCCSTCVCCCSSCICCCNATLWQCCNAAQQLLPYVRTVAKGCLHLQQHVTYYLKLRPATASGVPGTTWHLDAGSTAASCQMIGGRTHPDNRECCQGMMSTLQFQL